TLDERMSRPDSPAKSAKSPSAGTPESRSLRGGGDTGRSRADARATPARACAWAVVRRVFEEGAWADRALHGEARRLRLDARDRTLATTLAYGTVQRRATLDALIAELSARPVDRLEAPVLAALRLGAFQLAFLDRVPAH